MAEFYLQFILTLDATLRVSSPLILCAMAGLFSERSGIIDISLEGKMLLSAFTAASFASFTGSPFIALGAAIIVSMAFSALHGFACITHRGNQVVSGLAINILASGLTISLGIAIFAQGGQTPLLTKEERFSSINLPFTELFSSIPVIGTVYREIISGHNLLVWCAFLSVILTSFIMFRTRFGLHVRAVGEKPEAIDNAGLSVSGLRYRAVLCAGFLCGIAGAYLSIAHGAGFIREMTAGKGYIALAALIFGHWRPFPVLCSCLMFGFLDALAARLQGVEMPIFGHVPTDLILALPYILTIILLAGFIGKATPPKAIGVPYTRGK